MGEVYRARDTRLDRTVAIKVLPQHLSSNPELKQRLEREARAISGLNHPNICTLHDIGHQDGVDYLVMEHLEGEVLSARLQRGLLPTNELLRHAIEIADALDKAHRQDFVHRDLKPSNVMLTKSGAKLLDFGLAKSTVPAAASGLSASPTATSPLTAEGTIVGTFQYMAPEQIEGQQADVRSDIFAFGAVLYEMATGQPAFQGKTQASLIAAILKEEPRSMSGLAPMSPPALGRLVTTCLAKDPDERRQTMHDVLLELRWIAEAGSQAGVPVPVAARRRTRERLAWGVAGVAAGLVIAMAGTWLFLRPAPARARLIQSTILPPAGANPEFTLDAIDSGSLTVSPDGRHLTFAARTAEGKKFLWVRSLDSLEARPLPGTENGLHPFWSPDSRFIAFFAGGKLKKIDLGGSPALALADASNGRSGSWNEEGVILFSPTTLEPIHRISAGGGTATPVTEIDKSRNETTHRWATFLPDGRHFLYMAGGHGASADSETHAIFVGDLESEETKLLLHARSNAAYASGHLLYTRDRVLLAHPFDPERLELTGDPVPIAQGLQYEHPFFRALFSVSDAGTLAYRGGAVERKSSLAWIDRHGQQISSIGEPANFESVELSPDETKAAVAIVDPDIGTGDIWVYDLSREVATRFSFGRLDENFPVWSPDGSRIVFHAFTELWPNLYVKPTSGAGSEELLVDSATMKVPTDWSPDGQFIIYDNFDPQGETSRDIFIVPLAGEAEPRPFLQTEFNEYEARFSPDGRWILYTSEESGRAEIYVAPFPGPGGKWQVSKGGGLGAVWTRGGQEILYRAAGGKVLAVAVKAGASTFEVGAPVNLFEESRIVAASPVRDGERILVALSAKSTQSFPIALLINWTEMLNKR
jgi:Tol biopolymer transport system component